jgi:hypothetical protein
MAMDPNLVQLGDSITAPSVNIQRAFPLITNFLYPSPKSTLIRSRGLTWKMTCKFQILI